MLYVDDEEALRHSTQKYIESISDFSVDTAPSAADALSMLAEGVYDAVVSDYEMPEMNGIEFLKTLRAKGSELPFIIYTGKGREEVVIEALNEGADYYLQKGGKPRPVFTELIYKINQAVTKRRTEAKLLSNALRLHSTFDSITDMMRIIDRDFILQEVNDACLEQYGVRREDIIGKNCYQAFYDANDICPGCDVSRVFTEQKAISGTKSVDFGNSIVTFETSCSPIINDGAISEAVMIARDVTEKREHEEQIRHLNEVLLAIRNVNQLITQEKDRENLLQSSCKILTETRGYFNAWIATVDAEGHFVSAYESGLGDAFAPMEMLLRAGGMTACGKTVLARGGVVVHEDPRASCPDCPLSPTYEGRGGMTVRLDYNGTVYGLLSVSVPAEFAGIDEEQDLLKEVAGDIAFALYSADLETRRIAAEEETKEAKAFADSILENVPEVIYSHDRDNSLTYLSQNCSALTGYTVEEITADPNLWDSIVYPEDVGVMQENRASAMNGGAFSGEFRIVRKDGEVRWVHDRGVVRTDGAGAFLRMDGSVLDITDRKESERRIEHLNEVLLAIRNVNQLITQEKDREILLQSSCHILTETRGYFNAWIATVDGRGQFVSAYESGLGDAFAPMDALLREGKMTACGRTVLTDGGIIVRDDPRVSCPDCPLSSTYGGRGAMTARLDYNGTVYGLLSVSVPAEFVRIDEEQDLLKEVAGDIAFALYSADLDAKRCAAEEETKEAKAFADSILENVPEVIYSHDSDYSLSYVSRNCLSLTGYSAEEMRADPYLWAAIVYPGDEGVVKEIQESAMKAGSFSGEYRIKRKDGEVRWVHDRGISRTDDAGAFLRMDGSMLDITDRKESDRKIEHLNTVLLAIRNVNQLITQEKDPEVLLQSSCQILTETRGYFNAWIATVDGKGQVVSAYESGLGDAFAPMDALLRRGGMTACGKSVLQKGGVALHEDSLAACGDCPLSSAYEGRGAMTVRLEHEGRVYGLLAVSVPAEFVRDEEEHDLLKEVAGDIAFALHDRELTEAKRAAVKRMKESYEWYATTLKSIGDGVITTDVDGLVTFMNPVAETLTGWGVHEALGRPIQEVFAITNEQTGAVVENPIERVLAEGIIVGLANHTVLRAKAGEIWPIEDSGAPVRAADGTLTGTVLVFHEVTERRRAERRYQNLNRVLASVWDVNRIISESTDASALLSAVCTALVDRRGYYNAWAAEFGPDGTCRNVAEGGLGDDFAGMREQLLAGRLTRCAGQATGSADVIVTRNPEGDCRDCPLSSAYEGRGAMTVALRYGGKLMGLLSVSVPLGRCDDEEERRLFREMADDIAHALSALRVAQEMERAESERLRINNRLKTILNSLPDVVMEVNRDMTVLWANAAALEFNPGGVGQTCYQGFLGRDAPCEGCPCLKALSSGKIEQAIIHHASFGSCDCDSYWEDTGIPLLDAGGGVTGAIEVARDVSERVRATQKIEASEHLYRSTVDNLPQAIYVVTPDLRFELLNTAAQEWAGRLGADGDCVHGRLLTDALYFLKPHMIEDYQRVIETKKPYRREEEVRNGDAVLYAETQKIPLMTDGDVAGILTIVRDIGEERRLRNGLTEINTKLNLLSSITRHDLLNQITAMLIYLEFIQDAIAEGNYAEAVDELDRMTKSLTNAEQIISFTREYQDLGVQAPRWQNLGRVVGSVTAMHDSGGISMVSYIDGIEVFADPMLNKIFINFLGNVAMHAGTATMVRIFFEEMADGCGRIVVEDDGQGVPADRKERIFEKGYGKNTGFGLFLTKEILAITRIGVAETGVEGEGARFEITVPAGSWRYAGHP